MAVTSDPKPTPPPSIIPEEMEFEFSDLVKLACLLCARQFKTLDQLKKHNKESDLHKVFVLASSIRKMLTLSSVTSKTRTYGMWRGGKPKPLKPRLKPTVPKLRHQNTAIVPRNDALCTINQTSHYPKAWKISANNGVPRKVRLGPQHHHRLR